MHRRGLGRIFLDLPMRAFSRREIGRLAHKKFVIVLVLIVIVCASAFAHAA
jgi:hypothetical protein